MGFSQKMACKIIEPAVNATLAAAYSYITLKLGVSVDALDFVKGVKDDLESVDGDVAFVQKRFFDRLKENGGNR